MNKVQDKILVEKNWQSKTYSLRNSAEKKSFSMKEITEELQRAVIAAILDFFQISFFAMSGIQNCNIF